MNILIPEIKHTVAEIEYSAGNDLAKLKARAEILLKLLDITVLSSGYHQYEPQGITLFYILSDSHLAIHTWPEYDYIHLDLLTCKKLDAADIEKAIREVYKVTNYKNLVY